MTITMPRRGKPKREEMPLPVNIQSSFIAIASGANYIQAAELGGTSTANLRKWRQHPDAESYIQEAINTNLSQSHSKFADAAPKLADRLIHLALDPKVRAYAQITAISECFKILQQGITDRENREELAKIREAIEKLEGGKPPEVIDIESD